jgi:hypothetical protein
MQIADRGKFLEALGKEGYDVNTIGDDARKLGQTVQRNAVPFLAQIFMGSSSPVIIPPDHAYDNARAQTRTDRDPQLHFYNEKGDSYYTAHWDRTSSNGSREGAIGHLIGGLAHNGDWASPQRVNRFLIQTKKSPQ